MYVVTFPKKTRQHVNPRDVRDLSVVVVDRTYRNEELDAVVTARWPDDARTTPEIYGILLYSE